MADGVAVVVAGIVDLSVEAFAVVSAKPTVRDNSQRKGRSPLERNEAYPRPVSLVASWVTSLVTVLVAEEATVTGTTCS